MEEYRAKLELNVQEVDALDDLIDSYLEGEVGHEGYHFKGVDRDSILRIQGKVGHLMEVIDKKLGFVDQIAERDKYIM